MPPTHAQPFLLPTFEVGLVFPSPRLERGPVLLGEVMVGSRALATMAQRRDRSC